MCEGAHYGVIVAGANTYQNYRHQANTCHAYQILLKHGIPPERIITMMYDDIAYNRLNPYKGEIINEIGGENVYKGVKIDYKGRDVTAPIFLKVLQGLPTGAGNGRVLKTGPNDHIFVYYSDHGGTGFLHFPNDRGLYARDLNNVLHSMYSNRKFGKMVIYTEACHSGSMFDRRLPSNIGVYAMTAANPYESSYGCCWDAKRKAFLGDQFSGAWMRDTEHHDISHETLHTQYTNTKRATHYSHVSQYGDINGMSAMEVGEFEGITNALLERRAKKIIKTSDMVNRKDLVSSWDIPYEALVRQLSDNNTTASRLDILEKIQTEQFARLQINSTLENIAKNLGESFDELLEMKEIHPNDFIDDCYETNVEKYLGICNKEHKENDYRLHNLHMFMNLCSSTVGLEAISKSIEKVCPQ